MRAATQKLKMHIQNVDIVNTGIERLVLNGMLGGFVFLGLCYALFLGNMVVNIVERRTLEVEARALSTEVSELELTYLSMSGDIDVNLSHLLGFEEIKPNFATRKPLTTLSFKSQLGSTLRNNEI